MAYFFFFLFFLKDPTELQRMTDETDKRILLYEPAHGPIRVMHFSPGHSFNGQV